MFNYQYMFSPESKYFRAHSGSFTQPLPWRHTLTLFAAYADTVGRLPEPFTLGGFSWQTGVRYEIPLPHFSLGDYNHSLVAGFDFKRANTNLAFGGPDLKTAYATTARKGQDCQEQVTRNTDGGHRNVPDDGKGTVVDDTAVPLLVDGAGFGSGGIVNLEGQSGDHQAGEGKDCNEIAHSGLARF